MFERFTNKARRVIVVSQDVAREMGHAQIRPEHLLVGLSLGDGLAAEAMARSGVDQAALRERVAGFYEVKAAARQIDKVPFSPQAKKCLEQSLRAALALGHNYIGTEHLFFGIRRQADSTGTSDSLDQVLGASAVDIHHRLSEMLSSSGHGAGMGQRGQAGFAMRSPALDAAFARARSISSQSPMTTGHLLAAMLADAECQVSQALAGLGIDAARLQAAIESVDLSSTSDATPGGDRVTITVGDSTTVIADPQVVAALGQLSPEQLRHLISQASTGLPGSAEPGPSPSGQGPDVGAGPEKAAG